MFALESQEAVVQLQMLKILILLLKFLLYKFSVAHSDFSELLLASFSAVMVHSQKHHDFYDMYKILIMNDKHKINIK